VGRQGRRAPAVGDRRDPAQPAMNAAWTSLRSPRCSKSSSIPARCLLISGPRLDQAGRSVKIRVETNLLLFGAILGEHSSRPRRRAGPDRSAPGGQQSYIAKYRAGLGRGAPTRRVALGTVGYAHPRRSPRACPQNRLRGKIPSRSSTGLCWPRRRGGVPADQGCGAFRSKLSRLRT